MAKQKFVLDDSMSAAWNVLLEKFWKYLSLLSLAGFLAFLPDIASTVCGMNPDWWMFAVFLSLLGLVLKVVVLALGTVIVQIRLIRGEQVTSDDLWKGAGKFWAFLGATIIYAWVVGFGLFLFVIPGIIFGIMFMFYPYFLVEHRLGPIQALKASAAITSGAMWELFFLCLILFIIRSLAPLAFIIGMFPAHMFCELTITHVYTALLDNTPPEQLPFPYDSGKFARDDKDGLAWDERMGYDDPAPAASQLAFDQKTDSGVRLKTPSQDGTAERVAMTERTAKEMERAAMFERAAQEVERAAKEQEAALEKERAAKPEETAQEVERAGSQEAERAAMYEQAGQVVEQAAKAEQSDQDASKGSDTTEAVDNNQDENDKSRQEH